MFCCVLSSLGFGFVVVDPQLDLAFRKSFSEIAWKSTLIIVNVCCCCCCFKSDCSIFCVINHNSCKVGSLLSLSCYHFLCFAVLIRLNFTFLENHHMFQAFKYTNMNSELLLTPAY